MAQHLDYADCIVGQVPLQEHLDHSSVQLHRMQAVGWVIGVGFRYPATEAMRKKRKW